MAGEVKCELHVMGCRGGSKLMFFMLLKMGGEGGDCGKIKEVKRFFL